MLSGDQNKTVLDFVILIEKKKTGHETGFRFYVALLKDT